MVFMVIKKTSFKLLVTEKVQGGYHSISNNFQQTKAIVNKGTT